MGRGANDKDCGVGISRGQAVNDRRVEAARESVERVVSDAPVEIPEVDHGKGFSRDSVVTALRGPEPENATAAVLYAVDQTTQKVQLPEDLFEERLEAAKTLGGEHLIPEPKIVFGADEEGNRISVGEYYYGPQEEEVSSLYRNRHAAGCRFVILRGDPGTGKNEWVRQMAAISKAPLIDFNLGPRFDVQDALGGDGLGSIQATDEQGKPLGPPITGSVQQLGQLARAAQLPSFVCLDEPEGIEEELVSLHAAFGSDIGDPNHRFLTVNSMTGEEYSIKVHPECVFFVTFNPGQQEARLRTATHNRAFNYDFEYPPEQEEANMMAVKVTKIMNFQHEAPELQKEYTPDEVMPMVRLVRQLRNAHHTDPTEFIDFPDGRQGALMFSDLLLEGYRENKDALTSVQNSMRYLLPGARNMSVNDRDQRLRKQFSDEAKALRDLAAWSASQNPDATSTKKAPKKKSTKSTTKKTSGSKK